ncbi:uncharacterized protein CEXT_130441 [Caerostris extrusa]|uniref:Sushi domain-containing protein n=1 Tax=Caerostris extrusa TaxID=172846 RepID=A0AAV4N3Q0_CAEEX|nr:uncharacterized protein CEXT_130441 [Caerostris extrusa]
MFIPNGQLEVSRDKATLHCVEGYTEKADVRIVCEKNAWTGPNLQCEEILCDTVVGNESLIGGEWHIQGRSSKLSIGTRRSLECREGFYKTGKPSIVTCLGNGTWSKTSATCVEIRCETPIGNDTFTGGEWQTEERISKFSLGTKRKLVCKEGYHINGKPDIVYCLKTGFWTKTSATCKANQPEKKDSIRIIAIAVGATVALLILLLLGLTIFLIQKKRSREVVVIYKPGEDSYIPASIATASSGGGSDAEIFNRVL